MDRDPNQAQAPLRPMASPGNANAVRDDARAATAHLLQLSHHQQQQQQQQHQNQHANPEVRSPSPEDLREENHERQAVMNLEMGGMGGMGGMGSNMGMGIMNVGNGNSSAHEGMKPMKRACNDCRQQKLRCDVVQSPFAPCSRCRKLGKTCTVDTLFKRVGRRDKYAEMQREIDELKWKLRRAAVQGAAGVAPPRPDQENGANAADPANPRTTMTRELGHLAMPGDHLDDLFKKFFTYHHPLLPFLDPEQSPDYYFNQCPLLGWTIVMIGARRYARDTTLLQSLAPEYTRFLWSTISNIPQSYHVVKALALICYWPLPTERDFKDSTPQLSNLMMQVALQNMLHLDPRSQIPFRGELSAAEQRDRLMTWAACNIVAESTSTILGLPPNTVYEGVLGSDFTFLSTHQLPPDLVAQLKISQFLNDVTKTFYCNKTEPNGLVSEAGRAQCLEHLRGLYGRLEMALKDHMSTVTQLHLLAANVHLHAFAFFLPPGDGQTTFLPSTEDSTAVALSYLYNAACLFLQEVMNLETSSGTLFDHCDNFIAQTIFSSTFAMVKIINSSYAEQVSTQQGSALFNGIILAINKMSLGNNDLASRVALSVPLMRRALGASQSAGKPEFLPLRIQFRMGVSHIYDLHYAWREQLKVKMETPEAALSQLGDGTMNNLGYSGLLYQERVFFDSMDWMFGDWSGMPFGSYEHSYLGRLA
ncbi:hypothetical protein HYFRA_00005205 [Hymenoscyphus fraxineus]|uniref:Zn(2)-C6 fungal-type domain-containing protein n=1 Tax=Hymenoscyphus fraxineus TaxID=746836 RepID=A0A9N9LCW4_9HELO|nr:hypothetical protein HYFRA_00005205 [Hymenoscyphus fraxineus]